MTALNKRDILALGFMTFALFVGAGNIIFPPFIGMQAGTQVWSAAIGFLATAVGLPVLTIIALARVGGAMSDLSSPLGHFASRCLAVVCYLSVGPLFATPRTATVSFEVGVAPLTGGGPLPLLVYSVIYFSLVVVISLYPARLLDTVGRCLAPLKILALALLGLAACFFTAGSPGIASGKYAYHALSTGFADGYLTMDTLAALVFGIVVVNAIKSRGITQKKAITRYAIIAGVIAGAGMALVYLSLFKLGADSLAISPHATNGAEILYAYVQHTFGETGNMLLSFLITLACLVTAIGLTCACAEYFSSWLPVSYRSTAILLALSSLAVSNLGLTQLIKLSIPVLTAIYPPCIVVIVLSLLSSAWNQPSRVLIPATVAALAFGILDGLQAAQIHIPLLSQAAAQLPLAEIGLAWLLPVAILIALTYLMDRTLEPAHKDVLKREV